LHPYLHPNSAKDYKNGRIPTFSVQFIEPPAGIEPATFVSPQLVIGK
jgi:hypothetical protein